MTRGFLSVDPLDPVVGSDWAGNPYSFADNDPLHAIDPLGLRAITDGEFQAYREGNNGALAATGDWFANNWEYIVGGAMVIAGGALMVVGGPVGLITGGALLSAGADDHRQGTRRFGRLGSCFSCWRFGSSRWRCGSAGYAGCDRETRRDTGCSDFGRKVQ